MSVKSDITPKPNSKTMSTRSGSTTKSSVSNEDIMSTLNVFKSEVINSNKIISDLQTKQFKELKSELKRVFSQISDLKAENVKLRDEIDELNGKVAKLETSGPPAKYNSVITEVLQELFEREKCSSNLIAYGVPESNSSSFPDKIAHDKVAIGNMLNSLGDSVPSNLKLVRLGKVRPDFMRPLKLICNNKESALQLFSKYGISKRSGYSFHDGFRLTRDKTTLQRKLLRTCHEELNKRTLSGEVGLRIIFDNGLPKVVCTDSKNGNLSHDPPSNQSQ